MVLREFDFSYLVENKIRLKSRNTVEGFDPLVLGLIVLMIRNLRNFLCRNEMSEDES